MFVMGFLMSMLAGIRDSNTVDFETMPPIVIKPLMGLGVLALLVGIVALTGFKLPLIGDHIVAYKILAGIIGIKLILMRGYLLAQMLR